MKVARFGLIVLSLAVFASASPAADYKIADRIKVPDGGFDYATFEAATDRIFMARTDFTTVIDTKTGKVSQLNNAPHGQILLPVPGTALGVLTQRVDGKVVIIDTKKDVALATIPTGMDPDGAVYDPLSKLVFVMTHNGGDATVIDPVAGKAVATITIGGKLEFPVSNGEGKVFVNDESVPQIVAIDVKTRAIVGHYKLEGCTIGATGLAYDAKDRLLISSCRSGVAKVLQADTGKEVASIPIADGPDAVIYDAARQLVFIPCGGGGGAGPPEARIGVLEVISISDPSHISVIQRVPTQLGSRTGTLDTKTGRLYLISSKPDTAAAAAPGARGTPPLAGSFEVLVIGP